MTKTLSWIGLMAALVILLIIPINLFLEPTQQESQLEIFKVSSVVRATQLYAQNCVICHGATGEGIGDVPALNTEALWQMSEVDLYKVISRGRINTNMAAWAQAEGGIFTQAQIEDLIVFVKNANWNYVGEQVAALGLTPPAVITLEVSEEMAEQIGLLPDAENLLAGLRYYGENCAACHNGNASGTLIAPALNTEEIRSRPAEDLIATIQNGVPGTLMASWSSLLSEEAIGQLSSLLYRWPELTAAGVAFPEVELSDMPATPEMVAAGGQLFNIACKTCHGLEAFGTAMAPALNNQLFLNQTPDAAIYQIIAGGVSETLMPAWGWRLSNDEILSLVAFLRSKEETAPSILPPIRN